MKCLLVNLPLLLALKVGSVSGQTIWRFVDVHAKSSQLRSNPLELDLPEVRQRDNQYSAFTCAHPVSHAPALLVRVHKFSSKLVVFLFAHSKPEYISAKGYVW